MWFNPASITKNARAPLATIATIATFQAKTGIEPANIAEVANVATPANDETNIDENTRHYHWLIHFPKRDPVHTCCYPTASVMTACAEVCHAG